MSEVRGRHQVPASITFSSEAPSVNLATRAATDLVRHGIADLRPPYEEVGFISKVEDDHGGSERTICLIHDAEM